MKERTKTMEAEARQAAEDILAAAKEEPRVMAVAVPAPQVPAPFLNRERMDLLKRTICKGATDEEFEMFVGICNRTRLDPFLKQIYFVKRMDYKLGIEVGTAQVGIDGFRVVAQRTGEYEGQRPVLWCGKDGEWKDVWLEDFPPMAAKATVMREGFQEPLVAIARWSSYAPYFTKNGRRELGKFWTQMPDFMIGKCAEALALRKAFPNELGGVYTPEEMDQAYADMPVNEGESNPRDMKALVRANKRPAQAAEPSADELAPTREEIPFIPALHEGIPVDPNLDYESVKNEPFGGKNEFLATKTPLDIFEGYFTDKAIKAAADAAMKNAWDIYSNGTHPPLPYQKIALAIEAAKRKEFDRKEIEKCF